MISNKALVADWRHYDFRIVISRANRASDGGGGGGGGCFDRGNGGGKWRSLKFCLFDVCTFENERYPLLTTVAIDVLLFLLHHNNVKAAQVFTEAALCFWSVFITIRCWVCCES